MEHETAIRALVASQILRTVLEEHANDIAVSAQFREELDRLIDTINVQVTDDEQPA